MVVIFWKLPLFPTRERVRPTEKLILLLCTSSTQTLHEMTSKIIHAKSTQQIDFFPLCYIQDGPSHGNNVSYCRSYTRSIISTQYNHRRNALSSGCCRACIFRPDVVTCILFLVLSFGSFPTTQVARHYYCYNPTQNPSNNTVRCDPKPPWPSPLPKPRAIAAPVQRHNHENKGHQVYPGYMLSRGREGRDESLQQCSSEKFSQDPSGLRHLIGFRMLVPDRAASQPPNSYASFDSTNRLHPTEKHPNCVLILSQNTLFSSSFSPFQDITMTTRPSRKAPSSLLSATQASSARTRSSSRLKAKAADAPTFPQPNTAGRNDTGTTGINSGVANGVTKQGDIPTDTSEALVGAGLAGVAIGCMNTDPLEPATKISSQPPSLTPLGKTRAAADGATAIRSATKPPSHEGIASYCDDGAVGIDAGPAANPAPPTSKAPKLPSPTTDSVGLFTGPRAAVKPIDVNGIDTPLVPTQMTKARVRLRLALRMLPSPMAPLVAVLLPKPRRLDTERNLLESKSLPSLPHQVV